MCTTFQRLDAQCSCLRSVSCVTKSVLTSDYLLSSFTKRTPWQEQALLVGFEYGAWKTIENISALNTKVNCFLVNEESRVQLVNLYCRESNNSNISCELQSSAVFLSLNYIKKPERRITIVPATPFISPQEPQNLATIITLRYGSPNLQHQITSVSSMLPTFPLTFNI